MKNHPFTRKEPREFEEKVIEIDRVSRATKGGQRIRFRALVVIGNKKNKVGIGLGKAQEVVGAIQKAIRRARRNLLEITTVNETIPHEVRVKYGAALLMLKPAPQGTSIIAGGTVRAIIELAGIKNIVGKTFGSANKINNAYATLRALQSFKKSVKRDTTKEEDRVIEVGKPELQDTDSAKRTKTEEDNKRESKKPKTTIVSSDKK